jgi:hypothetical protein
LTAVSAVTSSGASQDPGPRPELPRDTPTDQLRESLRRLLATLLDRAFGIALDKVEQLARTFDEIAARGGYKIGALFGGARAAVSGHNPIWGAIEGAVAALSPGAKAALIIVLILALVLLPVTVVLVLLFLIVVAVVAVARTRSAN